MNDGLCGIHSLCDYLIVVDLVKKSPIAVTVRMNLRVFVAMLAKKSGRHIGRNEMQS